MSVLPHYSPGYPQWDISEQPRLLNLIMRDGVETPSTIQVLDSGMLRPKKSLLAVFGLTNHTERARRLIDLIPCENCSFNPCQYRRAPYAHVSEYSNTLGFLQAEKPADEIPPAPVGLDHNAQYIVNSKALARWAGERLTLTQLPDGSIEALFHYEGTTCSNMGRALYFDYHLVLGPREEGYPLRNLHCQPAPGSDGHTYMCRFMANAEHLMVAIDHEKPLLGRPLNDVLSWQRPTTGAGCYCEPVSRRHKWGLVFETIHFALVQQEKSASAHTEQKAGRL
jgi:hypothetical protein